MIKFIFSVLEYSLIVHNLVYYQCTRRLEAFYYNIEVSVLFIEIISYNRIYCKNSVLCPAFSVKNTFVFAEKIMIEIDLK